MPIKTEPIDNEFLDKENKPRFTENKKVFVKTEKIQTTINNFFQIKQEKQEVKKELLIRKCAVNLIDLKVDSNFNFNKLEIIGSKSGV